METGRRVSFPDELLEGRQIETTIFTPSNDDVGVVALSEQEDAVLTLRLYQLTRFDDDPDYHPVQELAAFSFLNRQDLDDFLERLPDLTGLEMLMLLNPLPSDSIN